MARGIGGRPTKWNKEIRESIKIMARKGFIDKEMCAVLHISEPTLTGWKKKYPEFFTSLNDWKHEANENVVRSLYERACGYEHPEDKIFCHNGEIISERVTKHYPPDATSIIFWLKNREPNKWRDKQEVEVSANENLMGLIAQRMNAKKNE